ncbi:MAG TPA: hypothetical protein VGK73_05585, partial [Polyangiaceae bacterium]
MAFRLVGALLSLATAIACIVGYGYMARQQANDIVHDERVWNAGGPEIPAVYYGRVTTRQFVMKSYDLQVQFLSPDGTPRSKELEVTTLFGGLAEDGNVSV